MSAPVEKSATPESPTTARPLEMDDDDFQDTPLNTDEAATSKPTSTSTTPAETPSTTAAAAASTATTTEAAKTAATTETTKAAGATAAAAATTTTSASTTKPEAEEQGPPKPPRPVSEHEKNVQTLKDAFPTVELPVIKAVLTASRGNIEAAFHALLEMTDPDAVEREPTPPPQPPRPTHAEPPAPPATGNLTPNSQLRADEEYARRLAQHYEQEEGAYEARTSQYGGSRSGGAAPHRRSGDGPLYPPRPRPETGLKPSEMWGDKEHSFIDDDLPVIRENLIKGFAETQTKLNTWFTGLKKRIDEEWNNDDDEYEEFRRNNGLPPQQQQHQQQQQRPGAGGVGVGAGRGGYGNIGASHRQVTRRSGDYDADPQVLTDDFAGIQLHGDGTPVRTGAGVYRPPSTSPRPGSERKVAFRGDDEIIDAYNASPKHGPKDGTAAGSTTSTPSAIKTSKWQPLSSVDPTPLGDDADPFSLGDSEDEKDATAVVPPKKEGTSSSTTAETPSKTSTSSTTPEDAERLRKAAAEAMNDSLVDDKKAKA